jgi:hypothetical protein
VSLPQNAGLISVGHRMTADTLAQARAYHQEPSVEGRATGIGLSLGVGSMEEGLGRRDLDNKKVLTRIFFSYKKRYRLKLFSQIKGFGRHGDLS